MDKLPKELQEIVKAAIKLSAFEIFIKNTWENAKAFLALKKDYPEIKILDFPDDVLKAFREANKLVLDKYFKNDEFAQKVLESQQKFLELVRPWTEVSEYKYLRNEYKADHPDAKD